MSATTPAAGPRARRRVGLLIAVVGAVVGALVTTACLPAQASNVKVAKSLFGMHDGSSGVASFGAVHEGSIRLWDTGVKLYALPYYATANTIKTRGDVLAKYLDSIRIEGDPSLLVGLEIALCPSRSRVTSNRAPEPERLSPLDKVD